VPNPFVHVELNTPDPKKAKEFYSKWAKGWRVPAYTRFAPLLKASSTSACPMPRLAPVTKTALSAIVIHPPT
jgi:hypothetical protein